MIPPRNTVAADQQSERRRPERTWTRREYKGRRKPLHRLLIVSIGTVVLLVGGGIAAPSTVSVGALQLMLPFFSVLAVASIGQHLVILTRGIDLSVGSNLALATVIGGLVFRLTDSATAVMLAMLLSGTAIGAINGLVYVFGRLPHPLTRDYMYPARQAAVLDRSS